jgi:hypothetical protein
VCAEANGKSETDRKHEAQLTILPVQHSKVGSAMNRLYRLSGTDMHRLASEDES